MDDQTILRLFRARSDTAIGELAKKYGSLCQHLAENILGNPQDAEECVNDAYHALWNAIPPEEPRCLSAYLTRIVRNLSYSRQDYLTAAKRDRRCRVSLDELDACFPAPNTTEAALEARHVSETVNKFLSALKKTDRVIFVRRYYYFDTCKQIGKRVGLSESGVNRRLARLREELRASLEKEDIFV